VEYKTAEWLNRNVPGQRVFVTGSIRFWYNVWHDGQQADGGSAQGILNPILTTAQWRIIHPIDPDAALHWLQALAVDVMVVPGAASQERYKDFPDPTSYDSRLPLLRDDGAGNRYYRVPRASRGIVRIVDRALVEGAPTVPLQSETGALAQYVTVIETAPPGGAAAGRVQGQWNGSDAFDVETDLRPGEALLFQESHDPGWRAYADGQSIAIRRDAIGFMLVAVPPGRHSVHLVFEPPAEKVLGRAVTLTSVALVGLFLLRGRWRKQRDRIEGPVQELVSA